MTKKIQVYLSDAVHERLTQLAQKYGLSTTQMAAVLLGDTPRYPGNNKRVNSHAEIDYQLGEIGHQWKKN